MLFFFFKTQMGFVFRMVQVVHDVLGCVKLLWIFGLFLIDFR